jgi:hypothetical protein
MAASVIDSFAITLETDLCRLIDYNLRNTQKIDHYALDAKIPAGIEHFRDPAELSPGRTPYDNFKNLIGIGFVQVNKSRLIIELRHVDPLESLSANGGKLILELKCHGRCYGVLGINRQLRQNRYEKE